MKSFITSFKTRYWGKPLKIALLVITLFLLVAVVRALFAYSAPTVDTSHTPTVTVREAGKSLENGSLFTVNGEVLSQTQGDLRTQATGIVTHVYHAAGDFVSGGTIIATLENASERASVAQAQAGVAQAKASLQKISGGTREEQLRVLAAQTQSARDGLLNAQTSAHNALFSAYATTDSAITGGVDALFNNPTSANPTISFNTTAGEARITAEHKRFLLQALVETHAKNANAYITPDTLGDTLTAVEADLRKEKELLDVLIQALNGATESSSASTSVLSTYSSTAYGARTSVIGMLSTVTAARSALSAATQAVTIAQENEALGVAGAQNEDVAVAQAQVDAAQAQLAQAYARLEDTYVRTPVSGTLTRLSIKPGDFVSAYQDVGLVANEHALLVRAYIAPEIAQRLIVGDSVTIDGRFTGVLTSIARSIDPTTRQIEIRATLSDSHAEALINGSRVELRFTEDVTNESSTLHIPMSAVRLIAGDAFVYSVENNVAIRIPVTLGEVTQQSVEILEGITPHTPIILDVRGITDKETVITN